MTARSAPTPPAGGHTPGKWWYRVSGEGSKPDRPLHAEVHAVNGGGFIADCGAHEHSDANAKLIAAAPSMVHGLEQAAKYLRGGAPVEMALDAIDHALRLAGRLP